MYNEQNEYDILLALTNSLYRQKIAVMMYSTPARDLLALQVVNHHPVYHSVVRLWTVLLSLVQINKWFVTNILLEGTIAMLVIAL